MITGPAVVVGKLASKIKSRIINLIAEGIYYSNRCITGDKVFQTKDGHLKAVTALNISHKKTLLKSKTTML